MKAELMRMALGAALACGATGARAADVVIENARCRLVLAEEGYAKSLVSKATGEEMLRAGARLPFSTITQNRAYDNEFKLMLAAKPWTLPAERITRVGDELHIRYRDEFFVAVVRIERTDDYLGFRLLRFDYEFETSGFKRKTEVDSFALAQLPVRRRGHFGRTLNVAWDDDAFVALMAARPETRIDAFDSGADGLDFFAGSEKAVGILDAHAVLAVAGERERFLDCVDAMERDYGLPRGVRSRRRADYAASWYVGGSVTPETVDEHIKLAKAGGFCALRMTGLGNLWRTNGHFPPQPAYAGGPEALRAVTDKIRAAGLVPGLHFFCTKVTTNDLYLAGGRPDPRMNVVCEVLLAREAAATDTTLYLQTRPRLLRTERNRGLVQFGDELVMYGGFTAEPPYALTNCVRGLWGSRAQALAKNAVGRHLDVDDWVIFVRCSDSGITDEIGARIAEWVNASGMRFFYMDGAEDVPEPFWYHVPRVQYELWKKFTTDPLWSCTALKSHFGWHFQTRGNGFDVFKAEQQRKMMKKYILRTARQDADDFSCVDLGWMALQCPQKPDPKRKKPKSQYAQGDFWNGTIGVQPDTVEYMCARGAGWNCPISFDVHLAAYRRHPRGADCLAVFRRWEEAKLAKRFTPAELEKLRSGDYECFLWPFAPAEKPEIVACRAVTSDSERPIRAFSYARGGRAGIVYWNLDEPETPEVKLDGIETTLRADLGRRFLEASVPEADLVAAFRRAAVER